MEPKERQGLNTSFSTVQQSVVSNFCHLSFQEEKAYFEFMEPKKKDEEDDEETRQLSDENIAEYEIPEYKEDAGVGEQ